MTGSCLNGTELSNVAKPPRDRTGRRKKKTFRFIKLNSKPSFFGNRKCVLLTDIRHVGCETD